MNTKVKQAWLAALRSGEYQQTRRQLYDGTGYCCLGVLCDLHRKATDREWDLEEDHNGDTHWEYLTEEAVLPDVVVDWADLTSFSPKVEEIQLFEYNDGRNYPKEIRPHTFAEIADLIEAHL